MAEIALIVAGVLLAATVGASIEYSRQLRRAQKEYEKAKGAVEDIVLSFNRQLKQDADKLELATYKLEAVASRSERALSKSEETDRKMSSVEARIGTVFEDKEKLLEKVREVDKMVHDVATSQESLSSKFSTLEEQTRQFSAVPEAKIEAVIPIRREKALAPLTETELSVLEMLASEGPKTAPEIKERIRLSREHTARLMKKLYEGGYLERDTNKIPFKYHVKEEMGKLLRKPENGTS